MVVSGSLIMKSKSEISLHNNVYPFLYLFTMDINRIPLQSYEVYESYEPGFSVPFIRAYIAAFKEEMNGKLSHALLKKINRIAMDHMPSHFDQYRSQPGNFLISFEKYGKKSNFGYSATLEGLQEFISYWIDQQKSHHMLSFQPKGNLNIDSFAIVSEYKKTFWCMASNGSITREEFNPVIHNPLVKALSENSDYEFYINTMVFAPDSTENIQRKTEQYMQQIFDDFHKEIASTTSAEGKISIIAKHIQRIEQLHPFEDGNIRTCHILLNKLLSDYGLPLSILFNPNKLDACSLSDVINMIKDGQAIYQQLINNTLSTEFEIITNENIDILQSIKCPPHDLKQPVLLDSFFNSIINRQQVYGLSKATAQRFFSSKNDFSCALRNACNKRELSIIKELLESNKKIELNQQSSNGNTALDWLDMSTVSVDSDLLIQVRTLLVEKGAQNNITVSITQMAM